MATLHSAPLPGKEFTTVSGMIAAMAKDSGVKPLVRDKCIVDRCSSGRNVSCASDSG